MKELISIVLCTYNGEQFLTEQIESLLKQTWPNLEIIISDDCSTDNTAKILSSYAHHSHIILYNQQKNFGPIKNFEFAASKTKGEFIAFCDQDDIWKPDKIEKLHKYMDDVQLVYSNSELIDEQGESLGKKLSDLRCMYSGKNTKGFIFDNVVWGHTAMITKTLLNQALPIPLNIPHDIWFAYKASVNGGIKYVDEVLTFYRQHNKTHTTTLSTTTTAKRNRQRRHIDFESKLNWINIMRINAQRNEEFFYNKLYVLYSRKESGKFVWPLFLFLIRERKEIFRFRKKTFFSKLIEILKQSRGERI